jgi:selenocysteine-specific elongation factor
MPLGQEAFQSLLDKLTASGPAQALEGGARLIHQRAFQSVVERVMEALGRYHQAHPLRRGASRSELSSMVPEADERLLQAVLEHLASEGQAVVEGPVVRRADHQVALAGELEAKRQVLEREARRAGIGALTEEELLNNAGVSAEEGLELIHLMLDEGTLLKLKNTLLFHRDAVEEAQRRLVDYLREHGQVSPAQFRDLLGVSRRVAIPLLEYFDSRRVTLRVGDNRILRPKSPGA